MRTHFSNVVLQKKSSREDKYLQIELLFLKFNNSSIKQYIEQ